MAKATMTAAAARRERGRQEMRDAILTAARRIVTEEGIDALSMRAVARAIGYSPAALYEYFPAKEHIYEALYFEGADGLNGRMLSTMAALPPEMPTREVLAALGRAYRAYAHEQPELYRLVFQRTTGDPHPPHDPDGERALEGFGVLVGVAQRAVERGEFVPLPPPVIACAAWASVHGFVMLELNGFVMGGPGPGLPPPSEEEGRARRDAMFEATVQMCLFGFMQR